MNCEESRVLIHEFLDGDIDELANRRLQEHLDACDACLANLKELQRVIALVQSTSHVYAPADFTAKVMAQLPPESRVNRFSRWFRRHPFLTAAAVFFVMMASSMVASYFERDQTLQVSTKSPDKLLIDRERQVVVVPAGETVDGDLIVRNGSVEVQGQVTGNVVAIEGKVFLASTAQVMGEAELVEDLFDWIWYQLKNIGNDLLPIHP